MTTSTVNKSAVNKGIGNKSVANKGSADKTPSKKAVTPVTPAAKKDTATLVEKTAPPQTQIPKKPVKAESPAKPAKVKKPKLVRDSFTIPKDEYQVIDSLKQRSAKLGHPMKKSELLRAGIKLLYALDDAEFKSAAANVPAIKTGRPKSK